MLIWLKKQRKVRYRTFQLRRSPLAGRGLVDRRGREAVAGGAALARELTEAGTPAVDARAFIAAAEDDHDDDVQRRAVPTVSLPCFLPPSFLG